MLTDEQKEALLKQHEERAQFREAYEILNLRRAKIASEALRRLKGF